MACSPINTEPSAALMLIYCQWDAPEHISFNEDLEQFSDEIQLEIGVLKWHLFCLGSNELSVPCEFCPCSSELSSQCEFRVALVWFCCVHVLWSKPQEFYVQLVGVFSEQFDKQKQTNKNHKRKMRSQMKGLNSLTLGYSDHYFDGLLQHCGNYFHC